MAPRGRQGKTGVLLSHPLGAEVGDLAEEAEIRGELRAAITHGLGACETKEEAMGSSDGKPNLSKSRVMTRPIQGHP